MTASVNDFVSELYDIGPQWYDLGMFLRVPFSDLDHIQQNYRLDGRDRCLIELFKCLQSPSWSDIADALSDVKNNELADRVRQKYLAVQPTEASDGLAIVPRKITGQFQKLEENFIDIVLAIRHALEHSISRRLGELQSALQLFCGLEPLSPREANFEVIFSRMINHVSLFSFRVLKYICKQFLKEKKFEDVRKMFDDYCKNVEEFKCSAIMKDLVHVLANKRQEASKDVGSFKIVTLKVAEMWNSRSLKEFEIFSKMVFQIHYEQLIELTVIDGCILVSWLIRPEGAEGMKTISYPSLHLFGCIYLAVGEYMLFEEAGHRHIQSFTDSFTTALEAHDIQALEVIMAVAYRNNSDFFLKKEIETFDADGFTGMNVFHIACSKGHGDLVKALLVAGWNPERTTIEGKTPLMYASKHGHSDIVVTLLKADVNPSTYSLDGYTALHYAAENGFVFTVSLLLEFGANSNAQTNNKWTPLLLASRNSENSAAALLLLRDGKANPNTCLADGTTSIYFASRNGNTELAYYLLEHGADPGAPVNMLSSSITPLIAASYIGHLDIVQLLADARADVNASTLLNRKTALHISCAKGYSEIASTLLEFGANPLVKMKNGYTPLLLACKHGHQVIADVLLQKYKVNQDDCLEDGTNGLHFASKLGHYKIVLSLLKSGANPDVRQKDGSTAMMLALANGHTEIVLELLNNGAYADICNNSGITALMMASQKGNVSLVSLLLEKNVTVDACDENNTTALHLACFSGNAMATSLLVGAGADVNHRNTSGISPLMVAVKKGHGKIVLKLLGSKAIDLNAWSNDGRTAIYFACEAGDPLIVRTLLLRGCDPNIRNVNNWSPLDAASSLGHVEVVRELLKYPNIVISSIAAQVASESGHSEIVEMLETRCIDDQNADRAPHYLEHSIDQSYSVSLVSITATFSNLVNLKDETDDTVSRVSYASLTSHISDLISFLALAH